MLHTVIGNADDRTESEKKPDEVPKLFCLSMQAKSFALWHDDFLIHPMQTRRSRIFVFLLRAFIFLISAVPLVLIFLGQSHTLRLVHYGETCEVRAVFLFSQRGCGHACPHVILSGAAKGFCRFHSQKLHLSNTLLTLDSGRDTREPFHSSWRALSNSESPPRPRAAQSCCSNVRERNNLIRWIDEGLLSRFEVGRAQGNFATEQRTEV